MKYFYLGITVKQDRNENIFSPDPAAPVDVGYYSYVSRVPQSDNIKAVLGRVGGLVSCNIFPTRKAAVDAVGAWNVAWKEQGQYLFDTPVF